MVVNQLKVHPFQKVLVSDVDLHPYTAAAAHLQAQARGAGSLEAGGPGRIIHFYSRRAWRESLNSRNEGFRREREGGVDKQIFCQFLILAYLDISDSQFLWISLPVSMLEADSLMTAVLCLDAAAERFASSDPPDALSAEWCLSQAQRLCASCSVVDKFVRTPLGRAVQVEHIRLTLG